MNTVYVDPKANDELRRERVYDGQVLVFSPSPASIALRDHAREMIEKAFGTLNPREAQFHMPVEDFVKIAGPLKPAFIHHPKSKELLIEVLKEYGCDLDEVYFDVPRMRIVTDKGYLSSGVGYPLHPHRDTWYSSTMTQVHWWIPIYDIEAENTLAFHPKYWSQPISNDSRKFNYFDWNRERKTAANYIKNDPRFQPHAGEPIDVDNQIRVVCPAGGIIMFSAAQLHSTVPNTSGVTRFSMDFRTVHIGDLKAKHGAPNIDSSPTGTNLRDFLRSSDLTPIPQEVLDLYEDPDLARGREEDLVFRPDSRLLETAK